MEIIDVKDWEREEYQIGSRKKFLYIEPVTRRKAYFKYPLENRETGEKVIGEVWSEKIAADVGKVIGVSTPEVFIAKNENGFGSLSYSFLTNEEELYHGAVFLSYFYSEVFGIDFDPWNVRQHRLELILSICQKFGLIQNFIDILIFDALIGNTDRHCENWGIVYDFSNQVYRLAPAYDNSSSLGREFNDDKAREILITDQNKFSKYIRKATACISTSRTKKTNHFEIIDIILNKPEMLFFGPLEMSVVKPLRSYLKENKNNVIYALSKLELLSDQCIDEILHNIPGIIMTDISKELVKKILITRRNILLEIRG